MCEGYSRFDVKQGDLGDCWLLVAMANLTLHRKLFLQVVPDDQSFGEDYTGVFHFRFWQNGRWVDVVIDDRLPTKRGKLLFLHSSERNEFWSALLEKAYAKLHGSYEALIGGNISEATEDFTGGVTEMYYVAKLPPNFFTILLKAYERNSLIGCSTGEISGEKDTMGVVLGHGYSLTHVQYYDNIPLLRLRNPWGNGTEWNGPWSDKSRKWNNIAESEKENMGLKFANDGEFWMSFNDFVNHFSSIDICNLNPNALDPEECPKGCTKKWEVSVFEGEWVKGENAGGCSNFESFWKNPKYTVTLKDVDEDDDDNKCTLGETRPSSFGPTTYQDFKEIRSRCLAEGKLFEDPEFPAIDRSLNSKKLNKDPSITWLRPSEICEDPQFFIEGYSRFDVKQGNLGDCWVLAAMANLTLHRKLFLQVVPNDQSFDEDYAGVFHFRFWQYGRWVDVVIDDRLPTKRGKLVFLHSTERNEFWSALLEKAYAKLHGSYGALISGNLSDATEDFTGGVTEMYVVPKLPPNFFTILLKAYERNSLVGCSIGDVPKSKEKTTVGLVKRHAYSVTDIKYYNNIPLLRLRNPWGDGTEWNGPWSDKSKEWNNIAESEKVNLGLRIANDGEFWMSFNDFVNHFTLVKLCNLNPNALDSEECPEGCTKKWEVSVFEGEWVKGKNAGGCRKYLKSFWKNPKYTVTLKDVDEDDDDNKCTMIVALMQKNRRSRGLENLWIGFLVYQLSDAHTTLDVNFFKKNKPVGKTNVFHTLREVTVRFKLEPGSYVIVPFTFNPDEEGEFLLRVFSEKENNMTSV